MIFLLITVLNLAWFLNAMPLAMKLVDMTHVFDETTLNFPTVKRFQLNLLYNGTMAEFGGHWVQVEEYTSGTHVGTHMDAPAHFVKGGITIDEIPVSQLFGPAAVIDITAKAELDSDAEATVEDLHQWESSTGRTLDGTIIMLRSGWGRKWHDRAAFLGTLEEDYTKLHFPGIAPDACQWLVDNRNIKGIGIDTPHIDIGRSRGFRSHKIILGSGQFILENVAQMDKLPIYGAMLHVLPMKIGKGSGAPTRIIATIPKVMYNIPSST